MREWYCPRCDRWFPSLEVAAEHRCKGDGDVDHPVHVHERG